MGALFLTLLALAAPYSGRPATVDVAVATLWQSPTSPRRIDAPALRHPVNLAAWNRNLTTTAARAGLGGRVVTQALFGEKVIVLAVRGSWAKVAVPDQPSPLDRRGYPGWVPLAQIRPGYTTGPRMTVIVPKATIHVANKTARLSYGTRVRVLGTTPTGAWKVAAYHGTGWIPRSQLGTPPSLTGATVVAEANRFLGLRYLWGGTSAWGFDCSGLVWNVFRTLGKTVPRDSAPQSRFGARVTGALRPGDLVFYGSPAYHVAIVAGHGMMVEAPDSAHAVRLVPLRPGYSAARRYA